MCICLHDSAPQAVVFPLNELREFEFTICMLYVLGVLFRILIEIKKHKMWICVVFVISMLVIFLLTFLNGLLQDSSFRLLPDVFPWINQSIELALLVLACFRHLYSMYFHAFHRFTFFIIASKSEVLIELFNGLVLNHVVFAVDYN